VRASTRVAAVLAIQPPTSAWALEQGPELTIAFPRHLEQSARPGVPAAQLTQVAPELQKDYSLMREAFVSAAARANNAAQPICLVYGDPVLRVGGAVATFELDASGFPVLHDAVRQPTQHDSWFGYVFWKRLVGLSPASASFHAQNSVFAMRDVNALAAPNAVHTVTYVGPALGPRATRIGHDWLVARLGGNRILNEQVRFETPSAVAGLSPELVRLPAAAGAARLALEVRGHAGATAIVAVARAARAGSGNEPAVGMKLDPRTLVAAPRVLRLGSTPGSGTEACFEVPASADGLWAQALVLEPRIGGGLRATWSDVLALER
jgi:hypothetical protein